MPERRESESQNDKGTDLSEEAMSKTDSQTELSKRLANKITSHQPSIRVIYGDLSQLPNKVRHFVEEHVKLCKPDTIHICDGSERENDLLLYVLQRDGMIKRVPKFENCWLSRTDPADVARVERLTYIATEIQRDTVPTPKHGAKCQLGNWMCTEDMDHELNMRFPNCMKGRTMFVIPFSMGPVGSPLSKIGVQLTDSAYVVVSMRIMTRIGDKVLEALGDNAFVKCVHSVGRPLPTTATLQNNWPCDPKMIMVAHLPERNEICSYGSGYGGNSLLGKKCLALRLGSILGHREGWLAEHMLILGVENTLTGEKRYIAAAFPSACGKTNMAMMKPTLPHIKVTCVGDDIAWMRFDSEGRLRAINPENGFFGVAPGTSSKTNFFAMQMIQHNTIFTNVAQTSDGGVFWEGLEDEIEPGVKITSWLGDDDWNKDSRQRKAAHPNSRFCTPATQCPILDPAWEDPSIFADARPFAMRPFFGYNFGEYLHHWLSFGKDAKNKLPKIFHVNWFRKDKNGKFLKNKNLENENIDMEALFNVPLDFWENEVNAIYKYFDEQVNEDLPKAIMQELKALEARVVSY
ncbi:hypothetical protein C0Q70_19286 [Pomacea canaliculata]|uniref:phosphoenolpyruvate carboxykinase (GTP) n=1 Tax=Pomacea canaliculata TaxID=400727 RepID=A0A2T7NIX0_POMCA|nr:hypothetical protein C0Q70_19286 [Pomacea canaliculata]